MYCIWWNGNIVSDVDCNGWYGSGIDLIIVFGVDQLIAMYMIVMDILAFIIRIY